MPTSLFRLFHFKMHHCYFSLCQLLWEGLKNNPKKDLTKRNIYPLRPVREYTLLADMLKFTLRWWGQIFIWDFWKKKKKRLFFVFAQSLEWLLRCGICPVQCGACMLDLLLPPKCLGRKQCIILVTLAVSSQFGHKWKFCSHLCVIGVDVDARTHTHLPLHTRPALL